jgi:arsenate reductase-like glutaredoxin family protein
MAEHPGLLQRPIALLDDRAVMARPATKLLEFLQI